MLEPVKYINHLNETLNLDVPKIFVQDSDLHDFTWDVKSKNDRISGFKRGIHSKSVTIVIKGDTEKECFDLCNRLFDVMEKDTISENYGKLFVCNYYLKCFTVESKKSEYQKAQGYIKVRLKLTTDSKYWVKETVTTFGFGSESEGTNLDFNRDFPSDYTSNLLNTRLNNTGFFESNFIMRIYGACDNPGVVIAGHKYSVDVKVEANEYLVIDSVEKTIVLVKKDGSKVNCFNNRNRDSYVFEKIPTGVNTVSSGNFKFDVTLLDERSEPKWT